MRVGVLTELQNGAAGRGGRQAARPAAIPHSPGIPRRGQRPLALSLLARRGANNITLRGFRSLRSRYPSSLAAGPLQKEKGWKKTRGRRPLAFFAGRPQGHSSLTKGFRSLRSRYPFSLAAGPWQKVEERKSALRGRRPLALFRRPALTKASFRRAGHQKSAAAFAAAPFPFSSFCGE